MFQLVAMYIALAYVTVLLSRQSKAASTKNNPSPSRILRESGEASHSDSDSHGEEEVDTNENAGFGYNLWKMPKDWTFGCFNTLYKATLKSTGQLSLPLLYLTKR